MDLSLLGAARAAAGTAAGRLYEGTCAVTALEPGKDERAGEAGLFARVVYSGPCRLSRRAEAGRESGDAGEADYDALLFLPPGCPVSAGCRITVVQNGVVERFSRTGEPVWFQTHTEVWVRRRGYA